MVSFASIGQRRSRSASVLPFDVLKDDRDRSIDVEHIANRGTAMAL
jgi:hypothetical protein